MREIKFRAWVNDKHMIYPDAPDCPCSQWPDSPHWFKLNMSGDLISATKEGEAWARIGHTWELLEYTGLLDKSGKEIYEGDVLSIQNEIIEEDGSGRGLVVWDENDTGWEWKYNLNDCPWETRIARWCSKSGFVIGNIYENPDLLNSK